MELNTWVTVGLLFIVRIVYSPLLGGFIFPNLLATDQSWNFLPLWGDRKNILNNKYFDVNIPFENRIKDSFFPNSENNFEPVGKLFQYALFMISGDELHSMLFRFFHLFTHCLNGLFLIPSMLLMIDSQEKEKLKVTQVAKITDFFEPDTEDTKVQGEEESVRQPDMHVTAKQKRKEFLARTVGLLYTIHPICVANICKASNTGNVIGIFFLLLSILSTTKAIDTANYQLYYCLSLVFLSLGVLSTPTVIVAGLFLPLFLLFNNQHGNHLAILIGLNMFLLISWTAYTFNSLFLEGTLLNQTLIERLGLFPEKLLKFFKALIFPFQLCTGGIIQIDDLEIISLAKLSKLCVVTLFLLALKECSNRFNSNSKNCCVTLLMLLLMTVENDDLGTTLISNSLIHISFLFTLYPLFSTLTYIWSKANYRNSVNTGVILLIVYYGSLTCRQISYWNNQQNLLEITMKQNPADWYTLQLVADELYIRKEAEEAKQYYFLSNQYAPPATRSVKMGLMRAKWSILLGHRDQACLTYARYFESFYQTADVNGMIFGNHAICTIIDQHNQAARINAKQLFQLALSDSTLTISNKNALLTNLERIERLQDNESFEAVLLY